MASILITDTLIIQALEAEASPEFEALWDILKSGQVGGYITPNDLQQLSQHLSDSVGEAIAQQLIAGFRGLLTVYEEMTHPTIDIIIDSESLDGEEDGIPIRSVSDFLCIYELECLLVTGPEDGVEVPSLFSRLSDTIIVMEGNDAFESLPFPRQRGRIQGNRAQVGDRLPDEVVPVLDAPDHDAVILAKLNGLPSETPEVSELGVGTPPSLTRTMRVILYGKSSLTEPEKGREYGRTGRDRSLSEPRFGASSSESSSSLMAFSPDVLFLLRLMVDWGLTTADSASTISAPMRLGLVAGLDIEQSANVSPPGSIHELPSLDHQNHPLLPVAALSSANDTPSTETDSGRAKNALSGPLETVSLLMDVDPMSYTDTDKASLLASSPLARSKTHSDDRSLSQPQGRNGITTGTTVEEGSGGDRTSSVPIIPSANASNILSHSSLSANTDLRSSPLGDATLAAMMEGHLFSEIKGLAKRREHTVGPLLPPVKTVNASTPFSRPLRTLNQSLLQSVSSLPSASPLISHAITKVLTTVLPSAGADSRQLFDQVLNQDSFSEALSILPSTIEEHHQTFKPFDDCLGEDAGDVFSLGFYIHVSLYVASVWTEVDGEPANMEPDNGATEALPPSVQEESSVPLALDRSLPSHYGVYDDELLVDDMIDMVDAGDLYTSLAIDIFTVQESSEGDRSSDLWLAMADGKDYEQDGARSFLENNGLDPDDMLIQLDSLLAQQFILVSGNVAEDELFGGTINQGDSLSETLTVTEIGITLYEQGSRDLFIEGFYYLSAFDLLGMGTESSSSLDASYYMDGWTLDDIFPSLPDSTLS